MLWTGLFYKTSTVCNFFLTCTLTGGDLTLNLPGWCWARIKQLALIGSSSSLHSEACKALGGSDGVVHSTISLAAICMRAVANDCHYRYFHSHWHLWVELLLFHCRCYVEKSHTPFQKKFGKFFTRRGGLMKFLFRRLGSIAHQLPFAGLGQLILMTVAGGLGNGLLLVDITNFIVNSLSRPMPQSSFRSICIFFSTRLPFCTQYGNNFDGQTSPVGHKYCKK